MLARFDKLVADSALEVTTMFIVVVIEGDGSSDDRKVFEARSAAAAYASQRVTDGADRADIFEVDAKNARAAIAALEMGEAHFIEGRRPRLSEEEYQRQHERQLKAEWEQVKTQGREAILKWLGL